MYLKHAQNGDVVEILSLDTLFDPNRESVTGRYHAGEELQEPETFLKAELKFPSGEALPRCWVDVHYRESS